MAGVKPLPLLAAAILVAAACGVGDTEGHGDAAVWVSGEGTNWTRISHPALSGPGDQQMTGATTFEGTLVAVGINRLGGEVDGRVWLSLDALEWTVIDHPDLGGPGEQWMWSVSPAGPGLIAVGMAIEDDDADAAVWTSSDGVEWTRISDPDLGGPGDQSLVAITVFGDTVIAAGSDDGDAAIWTSHDGMTWSRVEEPEILGGEREQWIHGLAVGGPGVVAVGADGTAAGVWTSPDGSSWSRITDPQVFGGDGVQVMLEITSGEHGLIAVGSTTAYEAIYFLGRGAETKTDAAVWNSDDGLSWSRVENSDLGGVGDQSMYTVISWDSGLIAAGVDLADPRAGAVFDADYDTGQDVDAAVWLSTDGASWVKVRSPALGGEDWQDIFDVIVFGEVLVAVGGDDGGSGIAP